MGTGSDGNLNILLYLTILFDQKLVKGYTHFVAVRTFLFIVLRIRISTNGYLEILTLTVNRQVFHNRRAWCSLRIIPEMTLIQKPFRKLKRLCGIYRYV